jgi:CO/xanthine dehydrogenase Mo-binding subunit
LRNVGIPINRNGCRLGLKPGSGAPQTDAAQSGRYRRGVGVATGYWLYLWQPGSKVEIAVKGGRLVASTATQDIGTGTRSVIANTVAREFGLEPHDRGADRRFQTAGRTGGSRSRSTASVVPPTLLRGQKLKDAIEQNAKRKPGPGSNAPGANCSRPRPISQPRANARKTASRWRPASSRR